MSILIRGMEMPTSCAECPCCRHDNWNGETAHQCNVSFITFGAEDENWIYNTRPNWCPLIELPPHGRLIDADKFKADYSMKNDCAECEKELRYSSRSCEYDRIYSKMDFCGWLDDAEVVIEAEGSEE